MRKGSLYPNARPEPNFVESGRSWISHGNRSVDEILLVLADLHALRVARFQGQLLATILHQAHRVTCAVVGPAISFDMNG
jgi:hypothetical protein